MEIETVDTVRGPEGLELLQLGTNFVYPYVAALVKDRAGNERLVVRMLFAGLDPEWCFDQLRQEVAGLQVEPRGAGEIRFRPGGTGDALCIYRQSRNLRPEQADQAPEQTAAIFRRALPDFGVTVVDAI